MVTIAITSSAADTKKTLKYEEDMQPSSETYTLSEQKRRAR